MKNKELNLCKILKDCISIKLPFDADEKLIGRHITWEDNAVELK